MESENLNPSIPPEDGEPKKSTRADIYDWMQCFVAAIVIIVLLFTFFARLISVVGGSMNPTLENGDRVVVSSLFYTPNQGDIVVLRKLEFKDELIIKRIIAVAGQTVDIDFDTGVVYVDDVPLEENYTLEPTYRQLDFSGPVTVPEGCVFVMGDNRNNSSDSRDARIGCVDTRCIAGRLLFRLTPFSKFGAVER